VKSDAPTAPALDQFGYFAIMAPWVVGV